MNPKVGWIGLGAMGKPMTLRLREKGYILTVHNRSRAAVADLVAAGAEEAHCPKEVAQRSDLVITCLPATEDVRRVVLDPKGVLEGLGEGKTFVDMSTISPEDTVKMGQQLLEKAAKMLDAPVSGGVEGAENGTLSIMVGGDKQVFEQVLPVLQILGSNIVHVGPLGAGQTAKLANQIMVAANLQGVAEGLALAVKSGLDPERLLQAVGGGAAQSWALAKRAPKMLSGDFASGFKMKLHRKDLALALGAARACEVTVPLTGLIYQLMNALCVSDRGELDHSALYALVRDLSDIA